MEDLFNDSNKRMPYTVPDGFFEEMHERLMTSSRMLQPAPRSQSTRRFWMSAAAAMLLIAGVSFYALRQTEKTDAPLLADQQESVEAYMTDDALDEWIAIYENIDNTIL